MPKPGSATLEDLLRQAKTTNRLLAAQLGFQLSQIELVKLLATSGLSIREIAEVLDTTPATVAVTLQRIKTKAAKRATESAAKRRRRVTSEEGTGTYGTE